MREKDSKIDRSILRVVVGEPRGAELPNKVRRGVGGGVGWGDRAESSDAAGSSIHDVASDPRSARWWAKAAAEAGSKMSAETKGELRDRRRIESRQKWRRWDGDDGVDVEDGVDAGNTDRRETESVRTGGLEWGRMNPRKFSTKDRERFGGTSRTASSSSGFVMTDLGSELDGDSEQASGSEDGSSSTSARGLAFDPSREPVADEHWETTVGESNKQSGLGDTCSILVMQSNASVGGTLHSCALRVDLTVCVNST